MMKNPCHPGEIIRYDCIEASDLTITDAAKGLGVNRSTLSSLLNGKASVSPEMAIRLEKAGWGTADVWLKMQMNFDLTHARQYEKKLKVKKLTSLSLST